MNRIAVIVVALALIIGAWFLLHRDAPSPSPTGTISPESSPVPADSAGQTAGKSVGQSADSNRETPAPSTGQSERSGKVGATPGKVEAPNGDSTESSTGDSSARVGTPGVLRPHSDQVDGDAKTGTTRPGDGTRGDSVVKPGGLPEQIGTSAPDGVDGNVGRAKPQPGDDGDGGPATATKAPPTLAGVKGPKVWLVATDLKSLSGKSGAPLEIGNHDGGKRSAWKNRSGSKLGDGVRVKGGTTATFVRGFSTAVGPLDVVALCGPSAKECLNQAPSQIKLGVDVNHPESWLAGPDKTGNSSNGGSSFTVLFVAMRSGTAAIPLMENQNGESGATKGPFLGWIGPDLVGSVHGLQGVVDVNAVALPSTWTSPSVPEIYTFRFDRKKSELRLFQVGAKNSASKAVTLAKGEGPDNDQYAAIAMGSKNPGRAAATYILEAATYARALTDREICAIHKEWNKKYGLKIAIDQAKPCAP